MIQYDEIKQLCQTANVQLLELARLAGLTPQGFRKAIDNSTLPASAVVPICERLQISLQQFFGRAPIVFTDQSLRYAAEIADLHRQVEEKDAQIAKLINVLSRQ